MTPISQCDAGGGKPSQKDAINQKRRRPRRLQGSKGGKNWSLTGPKNWALQNRSSVGRPGDPLALAARSPACTL